MTDERLRSLDRAARANPKDAAAGKALAHAYLQVGERRAAWLEYARVGRLGDAEARTTLETWAPRSHPAQVVTRRPGLPERTRRREVEWAGEVVAGEPVASDTSLVLPMRTHLVAVDPVDLGVRWRVDAQAWPTALRGDDVVHASGSTLVVRDGGTGDALGQTSLAGRITDVMVWGDRALVVHEAPGIRRVSAIDVGASLGRVLWSREWPANALELARGARHRVIFVTRDRVEVVDLETGKTTCARALMTQQPRSTSYERVRVADTRGVLLEEITPDLAGGPATCRVSELDLGRLEARWSVLERTDLLDLLAGDGVALMWLDAGERMITIDRSSGATKQRETLNPLLSFCWCDGAAYAVERDDEGVAVMVREPLTLAPRAQRRLSASAAQPFEHSAEIVPFANALVAVLPHRDRTTLVRIEADG